MVIALHDKFDSWQVQDKLDAYCKETYQSFVKDDSKTVESVNKHRKEPFPAELSLLSWGCHASITGRNANFFSVDVQTILFVLLHYFVLLFPVLSEQSVEFCFQVF